MRSISGTTSTKTTTLESGMKSNGSSNYQSSSFASNNQNSSEWESFRKQARQLENEIDSKLVSFSKLCSNVAASSYTQNNSLTRTNSGASTSGSSSSDIMFLTLSNEIEDALQRLTTLNGKMSECLSNENTITSSGTVHTLQRHQDILRDYSHEYEKTKRNIQSYKEREKLLSLSSNRSSNESSLNNRRLDNNNPNGSNSSSFYMNKEYDHLKSSHILIDQQLETAEITNKNLLSQRQSMKLIQQKMNTLVHKFPLINNLVKRVKLKKRKDTIILATVISVCLILMLLYIF